MVVPTSTEKKLAPLMRRREQPEAGTRPGKNTKACGGCVSCTNTAHGAAFGAQLALVIGAALPVFTQGGFSSSNVRTPKLGRYKPVALTGATTPLSVVVLTGTTLASSVLPMRARVGKNKVGGTVGALASGLVAVKKPLPAMVSVLPAALTMRCVPPPSAGCTVKLGEPPSKTGACAAMLMMNGALTTSSMLVTVHCTGPVQNAGMA